MVETSSNPITPPTTATACVVVPMTTIPKGVLRYSTLLGNAGLKAIEQQELILYYNPDVLNRLRALHELMKDSQTQTWWRKQGVQHACKIDDAKRALAAALSAVNPELVEMRLLATQSGTDSALPSRTHPLKFVLADGLEALQKIANLEPIELFPTGKGCNPQRNR